MIVSKHLLGLAGVRREEISIILQTAQFFKEVLNRPIPKVPTLRGKTIVNLFFENSTRTRISFELAEKRLSADSVSFSTTGSSVAKGETLLDTVRNLEAMKIDMVVIRHSASGAPHFLATLIDAGVINAGDGRHEHPTQALLDMMTLLDKFGTLEGLKVAIVGDIAHSRVARSNIHGLRTMGAKVALCGPATLLPREPREAFGNDIEIFTNVDDAIRWADALNVLRLQLERQAGGLLPSIREYANYFGITRRRLEAAKRDLVIMHPGPINRGVELESELADSEFSVILDQVTNGVAVRMAVLYLKSGGDLEVANGAG
ncbi:MAG: aspartate carbamoyltransferase catalytic subunit [candidate division KSB1 bacterium]|nr:aspartate carbamoyltransferase catalytic subunit [candidate division KSB1 bacterium]MDZ7275054.1 aspartate carbamoyltransferase catalytic subunit [candidate division KSB1 bacterium]MDZ7286498.1 aspartate carbamoyltransferase catalytic subunit [candidate division KSB1 bacterium]MDZ7299338.1 aspartate carbamoyltransferase catalytic subunit [candidate division KSB1 bacterium]MDZ7350202.1 aspartate carbamoyltransferase catalytic subunit [candidate division KSB1 bacterium]